MSDTDTSGLQGNAPAETLTAPRGDQPANSGPAPVGAFGTNTGSGLARGKSKRAAANSKVEASDETTSYKPTAIEVVTPQSEYQNPFNPDIKQAAAPKQAMEKPVPAESAPEPKPKPSSVRQPEPAEAPKAAAPIKAELNILPPAEDKRSTQEWKASSTPTARNDRPREPRTTFQTERQARRRSQSGVRDSESRSDGAERSPRSRRRSDDSNRQARSAGPTHSRASATSADKSGGFIGWLKGLFGGGESEVSRTEARPSRNGDRRGSQRGGRNRNRRSGSNRSSGDRQAGTNRGSGEGGQRRRSRGGRGNRGQGHNPNPEGRKSGGAI